MENLNEGKKSNYMTELAEIDKQSALVALEAKINKLAEMAEAKTNRLSMVHEDENLSELISKQAVKEMQRSIKEIEKLKEKLLKEFTKKGGKMTEVIDETEEVVAEETVEEEVEEACSSTYEEDDIEEGIEAELKKNKGVTWDEAEPAQVTKEKGLAEEEFSRWQKLAGVYLNENKTLKEGADVSVLKKLGVDSDVMGIVKKIRAAIESGKVKDADVGTIDGIGDAVKKMMIDSAESFLK